jgi:predicted nucleic acid-binding protein
MAHLIDTSVFIGLERHNAHMRDVARSMPDEPVAIASITASELLAGVYRANSPARRLRRETIVEAILGIVSVVSFDMRVARVHAKIWMQLAARGEIIGAHDLLIAATALAYDDAVLTENLRDFQRVPELVVHQPEW